MSNENDYIKRHEFERSNGKIYERINQTDRKLVELSGKIDTQNAIQEKLSISRTFRETFRKISGEISKVKDGFNDVKIK